MTTTRRGGAIPLIKDAKKAGSLSLHLNDSASFICELLDAILINAAGVVKNSSINMDSIINSSFMHALDPVLTLISDQSISDG